MSVEVVDILRNIGYGELKDYGKFFRTRPLYRPSDNNTVLLIDKNLGTWYDFKTREHGSLADLIRVSINATHEQISSILGGFNGKIVKTNEPEVEDTVVYSNDILYKLEDDHTYWEGRHVSASTVKLFKGGVAMTGKMFGRYVFPIFDNRGRIVGFAGRDIFKNSGPDRVKWKLIGKKTQWLYPFYFNSVELMSDKDIYIVESIGDMLALWEAGIKNVLVAFGTSISSDLISLLLKLDPRRIFLSFNNDQTSIINGKEVTPGMDGVEDAREALLNFFDDGQVITKLPPKKDFGLMRPQEIVTWKNQ